MHQLRLLEVWLTFPRLAGLIVSAHRDLFSVVSSELPILYQ